MRIFDKTGLGPTCAAAIALAAASPAMSAQYIANFTTLNSSGVTGSALLDLDEMARLLTVTFNVSGLDPSGPHVAHIHGLFTPGGQPKNSFTPTLAQDTDGDGFIEVGEGAATYGPILLPLGDIGSSATGTSTFSMTYDLSDSSIFNNGFDADDLTPLQLREIVIHGLTVPDGLGAGTPGEVDGTNGYLAVLPVASAEIQPFNAAAAVPEPSTWALLILGFGAVGGTMRLRSSKARRDQTSVRFS